MTKDAWKRFSDEGYKHYQVVECGFKYNMMDFQAAIGIHQLKRVESYWRRRQECRERYNAALADTGLALPLPPDSDTRHALHLYTVRVGRRALQGITRDDFLNAMTAHHIGTGVHSTLASPSILITSGPLAGKPRIILPQWPWDGAR